MANLSWIHLAFITLSMGKYEEYKDLLGLPDLEWLQIPLTDPQSLNIEFVIDEKIRAVMPRLTNQPFFVEDTSLIIDAWKGLPGTLTHTFMDTVGSQGICKMMRGYKDNERTARAITLIGYFSKEVGIRRFQGEVMGTIASEPRGSQGFGWDSIFIPDGSIHTFAEMDLDGKNKFSMRKVAAAKFKEYLEQQ